jgi:hypothetical protein
VQASGSFRGCEWTKKDHRTRVVFLVFDLWRIELFFI